MKTITVLIYGAISCSYWKTDASVVFLLIITHANGILYITESREYFNIDNNAEKTIDYPKILIHADNHIKTIFDFSVNLINIKRKLKLMCKSVLK